MHFPSQSSFVFLFFITLTKFSFACENWSDHATDVIKLLNVSLTSEAINDPGKTPSTNGLAYITVNGKNYAPQTKGFNVAVFDLLSGRFLTSAAFDCGATQAKCNELGTFLSGLPQDTVVLIAIQESGLVSGRSLPTSQLEEVGIQSSSTLGANSSLTSIGYKGKNAVDWKNEAHNNDSAGSTTIAALIPINCSYVPSASTTCSPFNVASQKYGGSCMNSSNGDCRYATDGNSTTGWESSSSGVINSYLKIGFHTSFTVNKLRIQQSVTTGQQIQEILLEFSDCSHEKFTLKANSSDFEELSFLSRPAKWIKFTVKKLYVASGGVGIQEIEVYNQYCNQKSLCDAVLLNSNNQSSHYRLHSRKFQFMIEAQRKVTVLLTSGSLVTSSRYEIIIGSAEDNQLKLKRIKGNLAADLLVKNVTGPLKENEMRSFWIEVETDRVMFGSGEVLYLFWRDGDPINVKYVFFSTTTSTAIIHVCGRTDQCYKDATHYWPLDKPVFVKDINNGKIGKIHGPWITERAAAKADFSPLALSIDSSASWVDLGDLSDSCLSIPSKCPNGFSLSLKASISGTGTGYLLSLGTVSIFYVDETMYFTVKDTHKEWEVKGAFKRNTWQTFSIGWSYANGLTAVIVGNAATVLYDFSGKTVTPSAVKNGSFTIGRPKYFSGAIRDVAIWELEISEERMKTLHVCNDPDSCPVGWEYFDGSCYKVSPSNLSASAAREACVSETADLVKIISEEENAFVRSLLKGDAWIGLEREPNDGLYYWRDGMKVSYEKWNNGSSSGDCVVMESSGNWSKTSCSSNTSRYVCEQVPYQYLGCYKDVDTSPAFVFNPGGYKPSSMTPGLCMHECGTWYYNYAAVKGGMLCLCSNSTSPAAEGAADMCFWPCFGSGNLKCGGESHISVFKSVTVWPRRLDMSLDSFVYTFKAFNITLTQTLLADETVESYTISIGDGTTHYTTHSPATIAILHPGSYYIKGTAIVKHSKTGYRSTVESLVKTRRVVSELTGLNISCQSCAPVNVSAGCSVMFRYGSNVNYSVQFGDGKGQVSGSLPNAAVLTVGTPAGEAHSPITSDGLYLMSGTEVKSKGEAVALEMDVETGGSLEIMVYRPTCTDSTQRYCPSTKTCISDITMCTDSENKTCDNDAIFSFSDGQCVVQSMSHCKNETLPYGNFDYQQIHKYLVYTTSGPKRIVIEDENQRFQLQPGDVFGVRFAPSGPTGALKTSSSGSSLFYSSAVINKTGAGILRGNYHPFTEDSPQNRSILPAIALVVSTVSESRVERVYEEVGHKTIVLSVGNSVTRQKVTKSICLQEMVTELQLNIPEVFPSAESVNLTGSITKGTDVTFIWDFGNNNNDTTKLPWVTKIFDKTGERNLGVLAGNKIGVAALWCQVVIQERIAGLKFKNDSLKAIENGTTASIGWTLFNGSHVEFNVTITLPDGRMETRNLTDVKVPGARFFGLYKSNFTIVGWYSVVITATNRVNNETIAGNLSVQYAIHGVVVEHPLILKTNETFNFTVLPHLGDEMTRYTLHTMDGKTTNSTDKVIPYTYTTAGRYKVVLIASNDVSSMLVNCTEIIVQEVIEGLKYTSVNHSVAVNAPVEIHWRLTQGSELLFSIDYGDGSQKIVNRSLSVGDIFVAISTHNYTEPGEYLVVINASNLVDSKTINTTVYVETPAEGPGLAIWRTKSPKAQEKLCNKELYIAANDSVTLNVTISNGTNLNVAINFGDNSSDESLYFPREFPTSGWSTNHSYSITGKYNITVTFFNRNPSNVSYTCLLIVQDVIEGLKYTSVNHSVAVNAPAEIHWRLTQGSELLLSIDYGDGSQKIVNRSLSVGDIFVAISTHSYTEPGEYLVVVNASNRVDSKTINTTVYVETPAEGPGLAIWRTNSSKAQEKLCNKELYIAANDSVTLNATISNGTNLNVAINFGDNSSDESLYVPQEFPTSGWSTNHSYSIAGKYNITVTFFNRNPSNVSYTCLLIVQYGVKKVMVTSDSPRNSSDAAVTLNVSFPGPEFKPSGPLNYYWRYGDNNNSLTNTPMTVYNYPNKCGVYILTVNVSNEISYGIASVEVIIQDSIQGLKIITNHTEYENQSCLDFTLRKDTYPVEYDVSFKAFITNGTNVTFTWNFDSDEHKNYSNETVLHKFSPCEELHTSCEHTIRLKAQNNVSEMTRTVTITLMKSILGVNLTDDGPTVQKKPINFTLTVGQMGHDSCFLLNAPGAKYPEQYEENKCGDLPVCDVNNCIQHFHVTYENARSYTVNFRAKNSVSCIDLERKVLVGRGYCEIPKIRVPGFESGKTKTFTRSEKITIETENEIKCFNDTTEFRWKITKRCGSDEDDPRPKEIPEKLAKLDYPARHFNICAKIEFQFSINMTWAEGFYNEEIFSIEIIPTPLVASISGGSKRTVGNDVIMQIDASKSVDPDEPGSNFEFAWFCNFSRGKLPKNISSIETENPLSNGSCFGYAPGQLTAFNETKIITLNTSMAIPNSTYTIRFIMAKSGRQSFKDQTITLVPGDPPDMSIECVKNCKKKLNPSEKFSLKGKGKSKGNRKIHYMWSVEKCTSVGSCSDERKLLSYSAVPDLTSETLVIKPDYFKADMKYMVTLSGKVEGGATGKSSYDVVVNKPPENGECSVSPKEGEPLKTLFTITCTKFEDEDVPLTYTFFYKKAVGRPLSTLDQSLTPVVKDFRLSSGLEVNDYKYNFVVKVTDKLGASVDYEILKPVKVKPNEKKTTAKDLTKLLDKNLGEITAGGNLNLKLSFVSSFAQALNEQDTEKQSEDDIEANKEFVNKLVSIALDNTEVKEDMNLADMTQLSGTLSDATSVTKQNSPDVINKVSNFIKNAGNAILSQAKTASSKDIQGASNSLIGTAINVIVTDSSDKDSDGNNTQAAVGTIKTVGKAMLTTLIAGEKEITFEEKSLALGVQRYNAEDTGNKTITLNGSEVILPANFTACRNQNSSVNRMILVSNENLYSGGKGGGQVTDKVVSLSFNGSKDDGSDDVDGDECKVKGLEEEISVMLPRNNTAKDSPVQEGSLRSDKYSIREFNLTENASAVTVQVAWNISVAVQIYIKKGSRPKPEEGVYDFNATFRLGGRYSDHSTNLSLCNLFLSNDDLNWTAAGQYFVMLGYTKNDSLPVEELNKIGSDDTVPYNFSMYTSKCMFYDEKKNVWSTDGLKVGPKTNLKSTECLTTHLTTFGSSFFVPPNKINFDKLSVQQLLDSPHALIFVCVILGLYLLCLIPARRADKRDALQTGVTPLPDNDSRDTYFYEIHVHTGFIRGAGTSAEVSIVLTGGLEETEPRVLKDPNRKNFKTGSVDPFLLTVPQSLGSLKHIRIWHNNGGNYPSWNLLRVMIQDLQTDQRWWFVCDDWLAVDEGDGKIERILYPASKKDLTKFNVLFTSEVRKNLTDGHIWFSVVARPPRSNFTRVQRLTCCLSILMTTLIANAMFYQVGENETPKNAIRIMGFSFSIKQVSIGFMSSMIVFPANLIIVTIFRKAKPKASQYEVKSGHIEGEDVDIEAGEEKKKSPKKFALPHWFVYVAYVIAFIATCTSASFVIMYGMEFGPEKSAQWLSSITISFIQDVLFQQPIKVFIMATLFALLIKDPKKAEQESFADANTLANDEEWLQKNTEDLDPETQQTLKQLINDKPPDEAKLEIARKLRMKERQMQSIIREIAWYVIFLLVLLTIAYGNRDLTTSKVTKYMRDTFEDSVHGENVAYGKVHEISHYWSWIRTIFIPSLMPRYYYDNITDYDRRFLADTPTAFLLGVVRLRQLRIKKDTCVFKRYFLYFIHECNDFYSIDEEDTGSYLPGWKVKPMTSNQSLFTNSKPDPWMYQTGSQLKTYPYWGYKATYSAGGFVQELPNNESEALNAIQNLSDTNWLDRYTRAIFSEFAIYNANTNLFSVVTLLFEQLPTGSLTPYPSILTLRLFRYVGGEMYFVLTCEIVYLLFCIYFVFKEIKQFVKKGKQHLKNPWSVLEIFLTCLSLTAVGLYFARLAFTKRALKAMNNNLGTSFVSFHYTAFLDEWLKCIIGIIVFLSFLKVFRLLRFNRRMSMLQQVLKRCFTQLMSFMIMFALAFLAFAFLACLVFGQIMEGFGTFLDSCASLMDTLLGKPALKEMSQANRIIGPIFFYSYTVSIVFILINMFVTIINDTFTEVRSDVEKQSNDYEIVDFMIHRLKKNIGKTIGHAIHPVYKEPKSDLELKFDKIVDDADNVIHFMRNMTFEDFRKTRWFQNETCTEKKKNLIRLLMEVDWDYYEDELCDSIPVFERFLSERSEEELEAILQSYRQKRMVEDLVFDKINGEDSSSQSDSDSDDSSDDHDNTSDDEQSSNDEKRSETEPYAESDRRPSTSTYSTSSTSSAKVPGTAGRVLTPALIITDVRPETVVELEQHVDENRRKSSFADQGVSDNELLGILEDVQRDVESRCATDAELDSILYEDRFTPLRCDSNSETSFADKKTKKRKKTAELPVEEKTIKEAWVTVSLTAKEHDDAYENTTEGMDGEENAKAKNKMGTETASEVEKKQNKRVKKKGKQNGEDHMSAVEDGGRKPDKTEKKKKKGQDGVDVGAEDNLQEETRDGEETKRKKKSAASLNLEVIGESDKKEKTGPEETKKKKKKKTIAEKAKEEDNGENGSEEQVERESRKESIDISAADEERPKEGERRKKRKKKKEAMEEKGEEKTNKGDVDAETETETSSKKFSEMFEEVLGSSCEDQTWLKKIKKKGKAKKRLVVEEDDGSGLFKSGETSYGSGEEQKERKFSLEESSVERKESADQTGLKKMKKKGKAKKKFVLEEEDGPSLFKSGETSCGSGEEQKERKFSLEESSVERKESVA